jgi:hypothetical protein
MVLEKESRTGQHLISTSTRLKKCSFLFKKFFSKNLIPNFLYKNKGFMIIFSPSHTRNVNGYIIYTQLDNRWYHGTLAVSTSIILFSEMFKFSNTYVSSKQNLWRKIENPQEYVILSIEMKISKLINLLDKSPCGTYSSKL